MAKLERTVSNKLKPMINRQYMDAATLITQGVTDVDHVVGLQRARLFNILKAHYHRVALIAGRQATMNFDPAKSMGDAFWNDINTYVALNTGRKVKSMQDTTTKIISKTIKQGVEEGETNREIATRLRGKGKTLSTFQALRIARTETLGMYNSATEASINEIGLKFKRIWSASMDMRTRRRKKGSPYDHWEANGQERKQNEPFDVSGEKLDFPGDPKGSAGNVINCRCVLLYERDRSNEMQPKPISGAVPVSGLPVITEPKPVDEELSLEVFGGKPRPRNNSEFEDKWKEAGAYKDKNIIAMSRRFDAPTEVIEEGGAHYNPRSRGIHMDGSNDVDAARDKMTAIHESGHYWDEKIGKTIKGRGSGNISSGVDTNLQVAFDADAKDLEKRVKAWYKKTSPRGKSQGWANDANRADRRMALKEQAMLDAGLDISEEKWNDSLFQLMRPALADLKKDKRIYGKMAASKDLKLSMEDKIDLWIASKNDDIAYVVDSARKTGGPAGGYFTDLSGSLTKLDVGNGHSEGYLKLRGNAEAEVFANNIVMINEGGIWNDLRNEISPKFSKEMDRVIEKVIKKKAR